MTSLKSGIIGIISFLAVVGFSTPATTYAWVEGDIVFSNIGNIYMPGYTVSSGAAYPVNYGNSMYTPRHQQHRAQYGGGWGWTTSTWPARSFDPLTEHFPIYYPDQSYAGGGFGHGYPQDGYGSQFGHARPTGDYDLIGQPLCEWYDYNGRTPCSFDPHQWIYDPYTGSWY